MCPYAPDEHDAALARIFGQDYLLMAESIDVFTPLIYAAKSGKDAAWGRRFLEESHRFVPRNRSVQLILDALDFPDSVTETARSNVPTWGFQLFGGASLLRDGGNRSLLRQAARAICDRLGV